MKIERAKNYPFVEPIKKVEGARNNPKQPQSDQAPDDRVEISREAKLRIELAEIEARMKEKINEPKAYAILEEQYRQVKQELEELEM